LEIGRSLLFVCYFHCRSPLITARASTAAISLRFVAAKYTLRGVEELHEVGVGPMVVGLTDVLLGSVCVAA
jgi:hypothetical protein